MSKQAEVPARVINRAQDTLPEPNFSDESGLRTIALFDNTNEPKFLSDAMAAQYPSFFLQANGLEEVLSRHLPTPALYEMLSKAPHSRAPLLDQVTINALAEPDLRQRSKDFLIANKGSASMHFWLIEKLQAIEFPGALCTVCDLAAAYVTRHEDVGVCTLMC